MNVARVTVSAMTQGLTVGLAAARLGEMSGSGGAMAVAKSRPQGTE